MSKINFKLHEEYKKLCIAVYDDKSTDEICGWKEIIVHEDRESGYYAKVYYKTNQIVIVSRGTELNKLNDVSNDVDLLFNKYPNQVNDAMKLYKMIKNSLFSECEVSFIGHSLGGSISQIMSLKTGCPAVTFNPYGTALIKDMKYNPEEIDIINYGSINDFIFRANMHNNIGETRIVQDFHKNNENGTFYLKYSYNKNNKFKDEHKLENMSALENSVNLKNITKLYPTSEKIILKGGISKNIYNDNGTSHWVTIDGNHVLIKD